MAIGYLSARYMKRSAGHSPIQRLAYIARQRLQSARTGETFDYRERKDLLASPVTLLPNRAPEAFADPHVLWTAVEAVRRADAMLGIDMVISLPPFHELDFSLVCQLLEDFLRATVTRHGLAATYAVHAPHAGLSQDELEQDQFLTGPDPFAEAMELGALNCHAHVMVTPKQVGPEGLSARRYIGLDPTIKLGKAVDALNWGRLWALHQNTFFASHGLGVRVRPRAPIGRQSVSLKDVRRWRKQHLRRDPVLSGRNRLVGPAIEAANQRLLRTIDDGLAGLSEPFTRGELLDLYRRNLGAEEAAELTEAALGLGGVLELGLYGSRWLATTASIVMELAIFGRAAVLALRTSRTAGMPLDLREGLSAAERELLAVVADGPDLVVIEAFDRADTAIEILAYLAGATGRVAISIAHGAGSFHPKVSNPVLVDVSTLQRRMISDGLVVVDNADALAAHDLDLVLQSGLAGRCQVVLLRRPGGIWPKSALVDLASTKALQLKWGSKPGQDTVSELIKRGELAAAAVHLDRAGRITRVSGAQKANAAMVRRALDLVRAGMSAIVLVVDPERRKTLDEEMQPANLAVVVTDRLPAGWASAVIAVLDPQHAHGPMVVPQLIRATDIHLIVDTDLTPTLEELVEQLALDAPTRAATCHGIAGSPGRDLSGARPGMPRLRLAVDFDGDVTTDPSRIETLVAFWASAPFDLDWVGDYMLSPGTVFAAIAPSRESVAPGMDHSFRDASLERDLPSLLGPDIDGPDDAFTVKVSEFDREDDFGAADPNDEPDDPSDEPDDSDEWNDVLWTDGDASDDPERDF